MGFWDWFTRKEMQVGGLYISDWQNKRTYYPDTDFKVLVKKYQSWIYACANKNAIACAQIPLRLYGAKQNKNTKAIIKTRPVEKKTYDFLRTSPSAEKFLRKAAEVEEITDHPFLDLMSSVNDFMNEFDLKETLVLAQELTGNAYWLLPEGTSPGNPPEQIFPLMPQFLKIIVGKEKLIEGYEYRVNDEAVKQIFPPEQVIHFKYPSISEQVYGVSPLQACILAADLNYSMNLYETNLMLNQARPDMALVLPVEAGQLTADQRDRLREEWKKKYGGIKNVGKLAIIEGGAELKPVSLSPKEMAFLAGRKATKEEIAGVFGVPLSKLTTEDVNRANAEAGDYSYMKDTILPRLRRIEQKINEQLMPLYDKNIFCAFDNPVPDDKEYRLREIDMHLKTGYSTINEERQKDGQKEVEWGDVPIMTFGMAPLGTPKTEGQPLLPTKSIKKLKLRNGALPPLKHPTDYQNKPLQNALGKYYRELKQHIMGELERSADNLGKRYENGGIRLTKGRADDYMSGWFDVQKWDAILAKRTEPFVRYTFMAGGERALKQVAENAIFDPINPAVIEALETTRVGRIIGLNRTIANRLRDTLAAGLEANENITGLKNMLLNEFDSLDKYQSELIARTETIWAWNEGAVQGYKQSGLVEKKIWIAGPEDGTTCEECLAMDGKVIGINDNYYDKGDFSDYEDIEHPPLHPACRCSIAAYIEEAEQIAAEEG